MSIQKITFQMRNVISNEQVDDIALLVYYINQIQQRVSGRWLQKKPPIEHKVGHMLILAGLLVQQLFFSENSHVINQENSEGCQSLLLTY